VFEERTDFDNKRIESIIREKDRSAFIGHFHLQAMKILKNKKKWMI
jgi:hypothetical protein